MTRADLDAAMPFWLGCIGLGVAVGIAFWVLTR